MANAKLLGAKGRKLYKSVLLVARLWDCLLTPTPPWSSRAVRVAQREKKPESARCRRRHILLAASSASVKVEKCIQKGNCPLMKTGEHPLVYDCLRASKGSVKLCAVMEKKWVDSHKEEQLLTHHKHKSSSGVVDVLFHFVRYDALVKVLFSFYKWIISELKRGNSMLFATRWRDCHLVFSFWYCGA